MIFLEASLINGEVSVKTTVNMNFSVFIDYLEK